MNFDPFGLFATAKPMQTVAETAREATIRRRRFERELRTDRARLAREMSVVEADLRTAVKQTNKARGVPLLQRFKALEKMIERIDATMTANDFAVTRIDSARITDRAMHLQRINANALHRINSAMSSDRTRAPMERLTSEVARFDAVDAEVQGLSDTLMSSLSATIEEDDITDAKWDEWVAMDAHESDIGLPPEEKPDALQQAINDVIAAGSADSGAVHTSGAAPVSE